MRTAFTDRSYLIESGQTLSGFAGNIHSLELASGRAWITIEGVPFDFWLNSGERLTLPPDRLVVIEADGADSRIRMHAPPKRSALAGLSAWFARFFARRPAPVVPATTCMNCTA